VGSVVSVPLILYTQFTGRSLSPAWFICLVFAGVIWDLQSENKTLKKSEGRPKLFLRINSDFEKSVKYFGPDNGEFLLEVEGDKKACSVRITSPDAVGDNHGILSLVWVLKSDVVGMEPIHVGPFCEWRKGTQAVSNVGSQIEFYMKRVVGPKELFADVSFKDTDGNPYTKKFRIYRERDAIGFVATHCEPVKD
jgi:hypothetical protein